MAIKDVSVALRAANAVRRYRRAEQRLLAIDQERNELDRQFSVLILTCAASGRRHPNIDSYSEIAAELVAVHNRLTELLEPWQDASRKMNTACKQAQAVLCESGFYGNRDA